MQSPQIVEKPELQIAGCEVPFIHALSPDANNHDVIPKVWDRLMDRLPRLVHQSCEPMYGLIFQREQRSHEHELWYLAGCAVTADAEIPDGFTVQKIPAGTYAVFTHRGPISGIDETVRYACREWLPQSGYDLADGPDVELYDERFHGDSEDSESEYWLPVMRR
ncbi:hypothetical protein GC176_21245 [bacterium]|nr:hypothetical protein [bacterium]